MERTGPKISSWSAGSDEDLCKIIVGPTNDNSKI